MFEIIRKNQRVMQLVLLVLILPSFCTDRRQRLLQLRFGR